MRNIYDVIREKEAEIEQLQKQLEALRIAARLMTEEAKPEREVARAPRPVTPPAPLPSTANTDREIMLSAPLRQFP